ncbi:MAG: hypothetical protein NC920_06275 [Candidatus Omnitrophica bacterium]|nr:hypothetical protein [Candidatus Omnitrophota bacterium]MCM8799078.1 hypothetical protein [Candidatus Omnitrophota bacterium]
MSWGERKFRIRKDLVITPLKGRKRRSYRVLNPLAKVSVCFGSLTYTVFQHFFKERNITEVQRHLKERHALNLSLTALESYLDLFLDLYLFEDCWDLYWERLDKIKKQVLAEEIKDLAKGREADFTTLPFVEAMILQAVINALKERDILKALEYLSDLLTIDTHNAFAKVLREKIEKKIIEIGRRPKLFVFAEEWKEKALELNHALVVVILLCLGISLSPLFFFSGRNNLSRIAPENLKIIQIASERLLKVKLDTL